MCVVPPFVLAIGTTAVVLGLAAALVLVRRRALRLQLLNAELLREARERRVAQRRLADAHLETEQARERERASARELELLHEVVLAGLGGGMQAVGQRICGELVALHGFDAAALMALREDGAQVLGVAGGPAPEGLFQPDGPTAQSLQRMPAQQVKVTDDLITILDDASVVQIAPIHTGGVLTGALVIESVEEPTFPLPAVQRLADHVGLLLETARAFDHQVALTERFRELDRMKTEFVATVSHELRTPLTAIIGMASTLGGHWDEVDEETRRDLVRRMGRQARRQQRMVEDLLTLSRVQQSTRRPSAVSVEAVAREVIADLDLCATVDVSPGLVAWVDRGHLEQMLSNYLTNGAKYAAGASVSVVGHHRGETVEVVVIDDGPGVPPSFVGQLFERFTQARTGSTRSATGAGLGLSIVRTLARANDGAAWYRPAPGGGSQFGLTLPRPSPSTDQATSGARPAAVAASKAAGARR